MILFPPVTQTSCGNERCQRDVVHKQMERKRERKKERKREREKERKREIAYSILDEVISGLN